MSHVNGILHPMYVHSQAGSKWALRTAGRIISSGAFVNYLPCLIQQMHIRMSLYESIYITHSNSYVRTYVPLCNANPSKVPVQYGAVPQQGTPTHCVHAPDTDLSHKVSIAKSHQAKPLRACIEGGGGVTDTYQLTQPSRLQACEDSHMHIRMYISMWPLGMFVCMYVFSAS